MRFRRRINRGATKTSMTYKTELIQVAAVALAAIQNFEQGSTELNEETDKGFLELEYLLDAVREERRAQEIKWGYRTRPPDRWMVILGEEVGEANRAVLEEDF